MNPYCFGVVTLFPDMFSALTDFGVVGRAFRQGLCSLDIANPRDFTSDTHRTVDDQPYGGGPGMVMKPEPLCLSIDSLKSQDAFKSAKVIYLSPQGVPVNQPMVDEWAREGSIIFVSGRYEGIDERVITSVVDLEVAVGDVVVSGGELPAMMLMDAVARRQAGVLGDSRSAEQDSFCSSRLDWPHYTRPEEYNGMKVPEVLKSGNHRAISNWRLAQACKKTLERRPDLIDSRPISQEERTQLQAIGIEFDV